MKTPREILLQQHRQAEPKLDALRQKVLDRTLADSGDKTRDRAQKGPAFPKHLWLTAWHELVRPSRYTWGGIAAAWIILLAMNRTMTEPGRSSERASASDKATVLQCITEERKVLAELLQPESKPAPVRTDSAPSPRSERAIPEKKKFV
jgi:hypothetical protein